MIPEEDNNKQWHRPETCDQSSSLAKLSNPGQDNYPSPVFSRLWGDLLGTGALLSHCYCHTRDEEIIENSGIRGLWTPPTATICITIMPLKPRALGWTELQGGGSNLTQIDRSPLLLTTIMQWSPPGCSFAIWRVKEVRWAQGAINNRSWDPVLIMKVTVFWWKTSPAAKLGKTLNPVKTQIQSC